MFSEAAAPLGLVVDNFDEFKPAGVNHDFGISSVTRTYFSPVSSRIDNRWHTRTGRSS